MIDTRYAHAFTSARSVFDKVVEPLSHTEHAICVRIPRARKHYRERAPAMLALHTHTHTQTRVAACAELNLKHMPVCTVESASQVFMRQAPNTQRQRCQAVTAQTHESACS